MNTYKNDESFSETILESLDDERATSAVSSPEDIAHQRGEEVKHNPYAVLKLRDFRLWAIGGFIAAIGAQMRAVAVGWELYERTGEPLALGFVGLAEFLPPFLLALPAGHLADKFNRQKLVLLSTILWFLSSVGLAILSLQTGAVWMFYACLALGGLAHALGDPPRNALLPQLVPPEMLTNAIAWNTSRWQTAAMLGPALGGFAVAATKTAWPVYVFDAIATVLFFVFVALLRPRARDMSTQIHESALESLKAGIRFVRNSKLILASITLDMFAVLFGGATALLPVFARDILGVGPTELGWMRAAPAVGALVMAVSLAHMPPLKKAGKTLLWSVAGFGLATVVFGLSKNLWLSLAMLFVLGALDNISVVVRHTLVQVLTPDSMRGRVAAVNGVFIGASNELGAFESGVAASILGPIRAVVFGGIATVLVVLGVMKIWPEVARLEEMDKLSNER
jgi:MFS family permease